MTREQLAHLLRAASSITEERDIVVIGSQAILGSFPETSLPDEAIGSIEADLTFFGTDGEVKADLVDGAIGELSPFHETHGIYAQGVSLSTAIVGEGWQDRLVRYETASTAPGRGWCLEPHDLVAAKLAAGRSKDRDFARALLRERLIEPSVLAERIESLPLDESTRARLKSWVEAQPRN